MKVNFVDLKEQYNTIKDDIDKAIKDVIENTSFVLGKPVETFEKSFARYCEAGYCVGVSTGSSALVIALKSAKIGPGDEVIVPVNTFFATASAVAQVGATPVFVDMQKDTYNIDPEKIKLAITEKTRAIIPVHLYGQPADMYEIMEMAHANDLFVIEDACQAHGAVYKGKTVGSIGHVGCFSFYPGKNLGSYGEGGVITTDRIDFYDTARMLRNYGQEVKYTHEIMGGNERLQSLQAAILNVKLKSLNYWNNLRAEHAKYYRFLLTGTKLVLPQEQSDRKHVYHLFVVQCDERDRVLKHLEDNEISAGIHYPVPLHLQPAFKNLGYKEGDFPIAEEASKRILSLPMYAELTREKIEYVCKILKEGL